MITEVMYENVKYLITELGDGSKSSSTAYYSS